MGESYKEWSNSSHLDSQAMYESQETQKGNEAVDVSNGYQTCVKPSLAWCHQAPGEHIETQLNDDILTLSAEAEQFVDLLTLKLGGKCFKFSANASAIRATTRE